MRVFEFNKMSSKTKVLSRIIIVLCLLFGNCFSLTGTEMSQGCHCDLIGSFCDFDCCCDLDCSATVADSCYNKLSSTFCIETQYYFKISSTLQQSTQENCYYFNSTTVIQEQQSISTSQTSEIINAQIQITPLPDTVQEMYDGYYAGATLGISEDFIDSNGKCVASGGTGFTHSLKFKQNIDITCQSIDNNINLFSKVFGVSINKYFFSDATKVSIPSPSSTYTEATLLFFLGTFGSQKSYFIQEIRVSSKNIAGSTTRRLQIKFIDPQEQQLEEGQPSFFPQIPYDIFFPIQQYFFQSPFSS